MTEELDLDYDRDVIGKEVEVGSLTVTREMIANYARAVGETNPLYTDDEAAKGGPYEGVVAPTGMLQTMQTGRGLDPQVKFGNTTFHAGQKMTFYEPVRPGDTITAWAKVKDVYSKTGRSGTMVFVVNELAYRNQHGHTVSTMEHSFVHRQV